MAQCQVRCAEKIWVCSDVENLQPEEFQHLIETSYADGEADASQYQDNIISFQPDLRLVVMAKLLVDIILVLLAILALIIQLVLKKSVKRP